MPRQTPADPFGKIVVGMRNETARGHAVPVLV
jgi:hypothetical protein